MDVKAMADHQDIAYVGFFPSPQAETEWQLFEKVDVAKEISRAQQEI